MGSTMKKMSLFSMLILFSDFSFSQNWKKIDSVFAPYGVSVQSFTCPFFADIDNDGDKDLFLGTLDDKAEYFENISNSVPPIYMPDTSMLSSIYANGLQFTNADYISLHDIDNDGDLDLFISGYNGILFYRNTGNAENPVWEKDNTLFTQINSEIGADAKPAFVDLDADGDLDLMIGIGESLLGGGPTAGIVLGYRNTGDASNPVFQKENSFVLGIGDVGLNAYPTFADLDNDGDYDMLMGRDAAGLYYFKNTGTAQAPVWTRDNQTFISIETTNYWKQPVFIDLDNDNDLDLVYGTAGGTLYYYENTGNAVTPQFQYRPEYFRVIKSEGYSTASLGDVDGDGDLDLISGSSLGTLAYFRNDGSVSVPYFQPSSVFQAINPGSYSHPVFVDIDKDNDPDLVSGAINGLLYLYMNNGTNFTYNSSVFGGIDAGWFSAPAFVDIDADGDIDFLLAEELPENFKFYVNDGNNNFTQDNSFISGVTFARDNKPAFADVDNDGDYDLFLGNWNGLIFCYENVGTPTQPQWQRNDAITSGVKVRARATVGFADLDNDNMIDMIVGEQNGNLSFYKNLMHVVPVELTSFYAEVNGNTVTLKWNTATEKNNLGFEIQRKAGNDWIVFAFVEGSGTTTESRDYSYSFKADGAASYRLKQIDFDGSFSYSQEIEVNNVSPGKYSLEQNYPNPFNPSTKISFGIKEEGNVSLKIYDVLGNEVAVLINKVMQAGIHNVDFNSNEFNLPSGIYYYKLESSSFKETKKMILLK